MMPSFLIIGAQKAGTTALWWYLRQHPDVFMPERKEPHHFTFVGSPPRFSGPRSVLDRAIVDRAEYERLFASGRGRRALGEASPSYLYAEGVAERIRATIPDARLIAILRQPAERAFSAYLHFRRDGREPAASFEEALALEEERRRAGWGYPWRYRDLGFYARQLARYYAVFPRDRLRVYLTEDLSRDALSVVTDAYAFLGVDSSFRPDTSLRPNVSGIPRSPLLQPVFAWQGPVRARLAALIPRGTRMRLRSTLGRTLLQRPRLDPETRARLTADFADDIRELNVLLERDLSPWLAR